MMRRVFLAFLFFLCEVSLASSQTSIPRTGGPPQVVAPTTTWSPTNKNGNIVLSSGNMVAAYTIDGSNGVGLATTPITSGQKIRIEIVFNVESGGYIGLGVANLSESTADGDWLGIDTNGIAYRQNGEIIYNNTTVATFTGCSAGDIIDIDVDYTGNTIGWSVNGVSVGTNAIGVSGDLYPAYDFKYNNTKITLVPPGSFTYAPPAGYTAYGL